MLSFIAPGAGWDLHVQLFPAENLLEHTDDSLNYDPFTTQNTIPMTAQDLNQLVTRSDLNALEARFNQRFADLLEVVRKLRPTDSPNSPQITSLSKWISPQEMADALGISKNTVIRRCHDGTIHSQQPGGYGTAVLIPRTELDRLQEEATAA